MGVDKPYREGRLKRELRRHLSSKESRAGVPKPLCKRERRTMYALNAMAAICLLGAVILGGTRHPFWMQTACVLQCVLWCVLAGLYERASTWQREASTAMRHRRAVIDRLLEDDSSGLSEAEIIGMMGTAADFGFASGDEVAEAFRKELGDE